jgi:polar amino acid transport system permease protein
MDVIEISKHAIPFLMKGLYVTAYLSFISGILAIIVGIIGGICGASKIFLLRWVYSIYVNIFRGTPFLIQLYIVYFVLPSFGITLNVYEAGIGTLALNSGAYISEIVRAGINAIPKEQSEAALSLGMTPYLEMKLVIFPQVIRIIIPPLVGQLILLVKDTSVISLIGVFDLIKVGRELAIASGENPIVIYSLVALFYFIICYPLYCFSIFIEKRVRLHYDSL